MYECIPQRTYMKESSLNMAVGHRERGLRLPPCFFIFTTDNSLFSALCLKYASHQVKPWVESN